MTPDPVPALREMAERARRLAVANEQSARFIAAKAHTIDAATLDAAIALIESLRADREGDGWLPIESAPKVGPVDLLGKRWRSNRDEYQYARFADCRWSAPFFAPYTEPGWTHLDKGWRPVAWMPVPDLTPPGDVS